MKLISTIFSVIAALATFVPAQTFNPAYPFHAKDKKIIEMGWDMPTARFIRNNTAVMQQSPFDGVVFSPAQTIIFPWELTNWQQTGRVDTTNLLAIQWGSLQHSFLNLWTGDHSDFSYFNESHWTTILANMSYYAKLAQRCGIAGICFDVEFYSTKSPWSFVDHGEGHTLAETQAMVRKRGGQIMAAFQREYPEIRILSMYMFSYVPSRWELLPYFVNGLLDSINTTARLIEGHEASYYWTTTNDWFSSYDKVKTTFRDQRCAPENFLTYASTMQPGLATYDAVVLGSNPSTDVQLKKWEHNHYMGMVASDEYVWVYTEKFAFWNNPDDRPEGNSVSYPPWPGVVEAIASAKAKYNSQQPLGWDMVNGAVNSTVVASLTSSAAVVAAAPGSVTIIATATGGTISRIDLYQNMQKIQSKTASPYAFTVSDIPAGTYEFIARVITSSATGTSNPVIVTVGGGGNGDTTAPMAPTALVSSALTQTAFTLSWTASTDDVDVTGYQVFKAGVAVGTTASTSYNVTGLTCATAYAMTVKARDAAGNLSAASSAQNDTTSACAAGTDVTVNDNNTGITYTGSWTYSREPLNISDDEHYTNAAGDQVSFTFSGTSISWIGTALNNRGIVDVYIDNVKVSTVDCYAATLAYQTVFYTTTALISGTHTIRLVNTGTKNAVGSSGTYLVVDAFRYTPASTRNLLLNNACSQIVSRQNGSKIRYYDLRGRMVVQSKSTPRSGMILIRQVVGAVATSDSFVD